MTVSEPGRGARPPTLEAIAARLRFKHLQLLQALGDGRSLRRAAEAIGITQPAATKTLQEIERLFGCRLFERSQQSLVPTERGLAMLRGARLLLAELGRIAEDVSLVDADVPLTLRLGAPPSLMLGVLVPAIQRLAATDSHRLHIELREGGTPELLERMRGGEIDGVVGRHAMPDEDLQRAGLVCEKLYDEEMQIVLPAGHPAAERPGIGLRDLLADRWIVQSTPTLPRVTIETRCREEGLSPPRPFVDSDSMITILRLVAQGTGVAVVPRLVDAARMHFPGTHWRSLTPPLLMGSVGLLYRRQAADSARITLLRGAIRAGLSSALTRAADR
jgi:DNA-binding transcriptional LysR family regulator